jgi:hypothetical protein
MHVSHFKPGDPRPRTLTVEIELGQDVRIGHAFREDSLAEVIANISNTSRTKRHTLTIDLLDDFTARMSLHQDILFSEWVPGGSANIVDNSSDTGLVDQEPQGVIEENVVRLSRRMAQSRARTCRLLKISTCSGRHPFAVSTACLWAWAPYSVSGEAPRTTSAPIVP